MHVRMTGCPNGCARPYMAEVGLVGDGPNSYQLYLGGSSNQTRLAEVYMERMKMQVWQRIHASERGVDVSVRPLSVNLPILVALTPCCTEALRLSSPRSIRPCPALLQQTRHDGNPIMLKGVMLRRTVKLGTHVQSTDDPRNCLRRTWRRRWSRCCSTSRPRGAPTRASATSAAASGSRRWRPTRRPTSHPQPQTRSPRWVSC